MVRINIVETDTQIAKRIHAAYGAAVQKYLNDASSKVLNSLKPTIVSAITSSPEMQSVEGGLLKADFGLTSSPVSVIVDSIVSTLNLKTQKVITNSNKMTGGFSITMQPNNYGNLFNLPQANQKIINGSLPWLEWLLTFGDTVIIVNSKVEYGPYGRTGLAKMTRGGPFKVNSAFSGTVDDNFITRALKRNEQAILQSIKRVL